jgi:hypothetical protein
MPQTMVMTNMANHQPGSGLSHSSMPSNSWPVVFSSMGVRLRFASSSQVMRMSVIAVRMITQPLQNGVR